MQQCGICSTLSGLFRRAMCIGSRRGSSESYYRELGDQDTLKIEDKTSDSFDDTELMLPTDAVDVAEAGPAPVPPPPPQPQPEGAAAAASEESVLTDRPLSTGRFLTMHKRRKKRLLTRSLVQETGLLDDLQLGQVQCILDQAMQWSFNAFILDNVSGGRCLPVLCVHLFHVYGLLSHFKLDASKAWKLFCLIEEGYHSTNPYHNTVHAADVTQAMHCFLQQEEIRKHLQPLEIMASLIAAIAHDIDHPGVNQPFLIATSNHLAALYKNQSVLENHHWRSAMSCIIESGLVDEMEGTREILERQISSLILATDITRQQLYLSQFKEHLDNNSLDLRKSEHRHLVLQIALKCADISNPCRPWEISRKWSLKVCEEFFRQGDYERSLNLPVTALCDRHTMSIPKIQSGFIKFVVTPLISEWHRFLHNKMSAQIMANIAYNQNKWDMMVSQEQAEETRTEISDADMVDDDLETSSAINLSESSELLLPLRRSSLNPAKQSGLQEQLRRFSVPLNLFQDKGTRGGAAAGGAMSPSEGSDQSLHSQLSLGAQGEPAVAERVLSTDKLLPDLSIASLTSTRQVTRLSFVLPDGQRLLRQQTFPPLEPAERAGLLATRPMHTSNDNAFYPTATHKTEHSENTHPAIKDYILNIMFKGNPKKTEYDDASENNNVAIIADVKENRSALWCGMRRESAPVGGQLRENLAALPHAPPDLLRRRKSMPAETLTQALRDKKMPDITELLQRTLSSKEWWSKRRGSAPTAGNGASRRKPPAFVSCQHWIAKASYGTAHERSLHLPRRSSLPVEVLNTDIDVRGEATKSTLSE